VSALPTVAGMAYREAGPADGPVALLLHGYPESSYMWGGVFDAIAGAGWRAIAPDLPGFGDSPIDPPGTWEHQVEAVERFRSELGLDRLAVVVHDWGSLIGLRWACDHPEAVEALVISNGGFFPGGKWHGMAKVMRTPGEGEEFMENMTPENLAPWLQQLSTGTDAQAAAEFTKCVATDAHRADKLELYRSGDFEKLEPYDGKLAALGVPVKLIWGADDEFAPVAGGYRFAKEIPGADLTVIDGAGHFVVEDEPERFGAELASFLSSLRD
jgi:haloalkane dehalogenase